MPILERIINEVQDREVRSAHIGFFTTAVVSGVAGGAPRCGLATTLKDGVCGGPVKSAGALAKELWVFELAPKDDKDLPPERMAEFLPRADAVAITALTLINGTFDGVLAHCRKDAFKILLGPSAPMSAALFDCGIDAVGGTMVEDIPLLLSRLGEGANFRGLPGKKMVVIRKAKQV